MDAKTISLNELLKFKKNLSLFMFDIIQILACDFRCMVYDINMHRTGNHIMQDAIQFRVSNRR